MRPPPATPSCTRPLWPAPLAGLAALGLYARTLAPGLTWAHHAADGGDLLAAALTQGVPHPSGYPLYQLLLRAAIAVFPGEPARAGNWLSALCAAAAVALFADLAGRMLAQLVSGAVSHAGLAATAHENTVLGPVCDRARRGSVGDRPQRAIFTAENPMLSGLAALGAALTWAASPIFWGQAVVTEVYALNALAVVALLWLLWRWREAVDAGAGGQPSGHIRRPEGWPWLAGAGAVLGLGLGNHLTLLLMLPGAAVWLWDGRRAAGRSLVRGLLAALIAAAVGLTIYAYLPLAAASNPPVNWGDPRRPAQLWTLVTGQVYRGLVFGLPLAYLPGRLAAWSGEALRQFGGPWGVILAFIGLWRLDRWLHAWWQATLLIALAYSVYAIGYNTPDSFVYLIPVWCAAALWLGAGLDWLLAALAQWLDRRLGRLKESDRMAQDDAAADEVVIPSLHSGQALSSLITQGQLRQDAREGSRPGRRDPSRGLSCRFNSVDNPLRVTIPAILRAVFNVGRVATAHENTLLGPVCDRARRGSVGDRPQRAIFRAALVALVLAVPAISAARFWHENDLGHDREAQEFVTRTLADAAPDAMILTSGDGPTFALWYAVYGLGQRPDVAPVNVNLVSFDWYRRALAERHPDFAAALSTFDPAQQEASLAALAAQRPLYRAETLSIPLPGYDERPEGSLVRLTRHAGE